MKSTVVLGLLGSVLDAGAGAGRWDRWRPSVGLCQQESLLIHRFELLHPPAHATLARAVASDLSTVSPETEVRLHPIDLRDPWDFEEVYGALHEFARAYTFDPEREDYLIHITTGTPAGGGRVHRGELRRAARRRGDVGALRPREGGLHGRRGGAGRAPAARQQRPPPPRRDRRARARRAGDAAARDRGGGVPSHGIGHGGADRLPAHRGHQPRSPPAGAGRAFPRRPPGADRSLDVPPPRTSRTTRGHRAQLRLRAGARRGTDGTARDRRPGGAKPLPPLRHLPRGALEWKLPRPRWGRGAHGDHGCGRPYLAGARGGGDRAPASVVDRPRAGRRRGGAGRDARP